MLDCKPIGAPITKGDKLNKPQCPQNELNYNQMKDIPYALDVGSLIKLAPVWISILLLACLADIKATQDILTGKLLTKL